MKVKQIIRFWLPPVLWAMVIFAFSSKPTFNASQFYWSDFMIKKTAHMVEYFLLTILVYRAFFNSGFNKQKSLKLAFIIIVFYAFTDVFHQIFTPGRGPHIRDVIFDTIGGSLAVYSIWNILPKAPEILKKLAKNYQIA